MDPTRVRTTGRLVAVIVAASIWAGCTSAASISAPPRWTAPPSQSLSGRPTADRSPQPSDCGSAAVSVDYGDYVIAGMHVHGTLSGFAGSPVDIAAGATSVVADVASSEPGFVVGDRQVFTPVNLNVGVAIRGPASTGPMTVLRGGGTAGCLTSRVYGLPTVTARSRYVLFLFPAFATNGGNPQGTPQIRFAWPVGSDGTVQTPGGPMTVADVIVAIRTAQATSSLSPSASPKA